MNQKDKKGFAQLFKGLCEYYSKNNLSKDVLKMYFGGLEKFSIDQVVRAAGDHMHDPEHGSFFPKICDFDRHIGAPPLNYETIIAYAKTPKCPLGILARRKIGTWNLNTFGAGKLKILALECLAELPEWQEKSVNGSYTESEIMTMIKHKVDPTSPLAPGLEAPTDIITLKQKIIAITDSSS